MNATPTRRQSLAALTLPLFLSIEKAVGAPAAAPLDSLRRACIATGYAEALRRLPAQQIGVTYRAVAAAIAQTNGTVDSIALAANSASAISKENLIALSRKLRSIVVAEKDLPQYASALTRAIDAPSDAAASLALNIASVVASQLPTSNIRGLDIGLSIDTAARSISYAAIRGALVDPAVSRILADQRIKTLTNLDINMPLDRAIGSLTPAAQDVANRLSVSLSNGVADLAAITDATRAGLDGALSRADTLYRDMKKTAGTVRGIFQNGHLPNSFAEANSDLTAVAAIGSYIFGQVLGDKRTAGQILQVAQIGSTILQLGLMFSTGGLGVMASAGGVMSALGAVEGLFGGSGGDPNAAVKGMLADISNQINALRIEMHDRFDRVEDLERRALSLLENISVELHSFNVSASGKLVALSQDVTQLDRYMRDSMRADKIKEFNDILDNVNLITTSPTGTYAASSQQDDLIKLLAYADRTAALPAFTLADQSNLSFAKAVAQADRADLGIMLFPKAAQILGLSGNGAPAPTQNPIEWTRGTSAFLETHLRFGLIQNQAVESRISDIFAAGQRIANYYASYLTPQNDIAVVAAFEKAVTELIETIEITMPTLHGDTYRMPFVGRMEPGTRGETFRRADCASHDGVTYVAQAANNNRDWMFFTANDDVLEQLMEEGIVRAVNISREALTYKVAFNTLVGESIYAYRSHCKLMKGDKQIGIIDRLDFQLVDGLPGCGAWQLPEGMNFDRFQQDLGKEIFEKEDVDRWATQYDTLESNPKFIAFEEVTAALLLYVSACVWSLCDLPDSPMSSATALASIRNRAELKAILTSLTQGIPGTEWRRLADPDEKNLRDFTPWENTNSYQMLGNVLQAAIRSRTIETVQMFKRIVSQLPSNRRIPSVDRALGKLQGLMAAT